MVTDHKSTVEYKDRLFRIAAAALAAFFVTVYGGDEDVLYLLLRVAFYIEFAISFVFTILIVEWVAFITRRLDRCFDWRTRTIPRICLQILLGVIVAALIEFLFAALYFRLSGYNILKTTFVAYAFPLIVMMIILFNVYYFMYYLIVTAKKIEEQVLNEQQSGSSSPREDSVDIKETILVNKGALIFPVPVEEIAYFYRDKESECNYLRTIKGNDFFINSSLDDISQQLNDRTFFRANRQMIVSYDACKGFELLEYGKLALDLNPSFAEQIIVSQPKARLFKDWYDR